MTPRKHFFDVYLAITSFEIDTRMWQSSRNGEFRVYLDKVFAEYGLDLNMSHKIWKYMRDEKKLSYVFRSMKWFEIDRRDFIKQKGPWIIYKKDFTRSDPDFFEASIVPHLCNNSLGEGVLEWISSSRIDVDASRDINVGSNLDLEPQSFLNPTLQSADSQTEDIKVFQKTNSRI